MTEVERLEGKLNANKIVITFLESRLETYRQRENRLTYELNRARRLEREAKELQP